MDRRPLIPMSDHEWRLAPEGTMRVPIVCYASKAIIDALEDKVFLQAANVAALPGIVEAVYLMPDAHWGYGFPIGGVAAFDAAAGGVVSAGGVGFDISCGVRTMLSGLTRADIAPVKRALADRFYETVPVGLGARGAIALEGAAMDAMLAGGASWAVASGYGEAADLQRIEEEGCMAGADPEAVSAPARQRQRREMGTLGSGNHYLEVQYVARIFDGEAAGAFGLAEDRVVVSIHCGSRGLGHQVASEYLSETVAAAPGFAIALPDRDLACAPIATPLGKRYLGAMRAAINCALANRQIIGHLARQVWAGFFAEDHLGLLFDVSHNTCKVEDHVVDGRRRPLHVHRKGATRAFPPGHPSLPPALRAVGQPVLIGGSMGTASYILAGMADNEARGFASACHGAGRRMSRHQAARTWRGRHLVDDLAAQGIIVRAPSSRGVAEEAPGAYKDVAAVVEATEAAGLARRVAELRPLLCIKG
ncbi:MAG: RtcB family protein [Pseudomonadota bacterium]